MEKFYMDELYHYGVKGMKWGVRKQSYKQNVRTAKKKMYSRYDAAEERHENNVMAINKKYGQQSRMNRSTKKAYNKEIQSAWDNYIKENDAARSEFKDAKKAYKKEYKQSAEYINKRNKLIKGVAVGAAVGATAYAMYNPNSREFLMGLAGKTASELRATAENPKVREFVSNTGKKTMSGLSASATRVGQAMTDAALLSIGTIAIGKLAQKLAPTENATESEINRNKVLLDVGTAGITSLTNASNKGSGNKGGQKGGGSVGKDVTNAIGQPSRKGIDKSSPDWQDLFKDNNGNQRDQDTRAVIKSLASNGYDIDQISEYLRKVDNGSIKHSDIRDDLYCFTGMMFLNGMLM